MRIHNRRKPENYKLRVYMDAIKDAHAMTDEQWIDAWITGASTECVFISRSAWIQYLNNCVLNEVTNLLMREAA